jgi:hypothetical protein
MDVIFCKAKQNRLSGGPDLKSFDLTRDTVLVEYQ